MTRAVEQLYIFSKKELSAKGTPNPRKYSGKLIQYLQAQQLWEPQENTYHLGDDEKLGSKTAIASSKDSQFFKQFFCTSKETHNIHIVTNGHKIWDSKRQEAIAKGILLHELLAKIYTPEDIPIVIDNAILSGKITTKQKPILSKELEAIVSHSLLADYFSKGLQVLNEQPILHLGEFYRPDRLILLKNQAVIIDYKTGNPTTKDKIQVQEYASFLKIMGYDIKTAYLVYITPFVTVATL